MKSAFASALLAARFAVKGCHSLELWNKNYGSPLTK